MHSFDFELTQQEVQGLHNADAISAFFATIGYNTEARTLQTAANLGIPESAAKEIDRIELIADQQGLLQVYLVQLKSVTVAFIKALARTFRTAPVISFSS